MGEEMEFISPEDYDKAIQDIFNYQQFRKTFKQGFDINTAAHLISVESDEVVVKPISMGKLYKK